MPTQSAGLLLYRRRPSGLQVLLVHMGGPIWAKKDLGAWSIPKGVNGAGEDPLAAAIREFREETGFEISGDYEAHGTFRLNSRKYISIWSLDGNCDPSLLVSNT